MKRKLRDLLERKKTEETRGGTSSIFQGGEVRVEGGGRWSFLKPRYALKRADQRRGRSKLAKENSRQNKKTRAGNEGTSGRFVVLSP